MAGPSKGVYVEHDLYGSPVRVVEGTPPERGYVLIAPGATVTPDDEARVKVARASLAGESRPAGPVSFESKPTVRK